MINNMQDSQNGHKVKCKIIRIKPYNKNIAVNFGLTAIFFEIKYVYFFLKESVVLIFPFFI